MAQYDLAALARRSGTRKRITTFRPIKTTQAQANDLARIYRDILTPWLDSTDRIIALYTCDLVTDSPDDMGSLFDALGEELSRLVLELTPNLRNWAFRTERYHREKWRSAVLAGASVDIGTLIGPQDAQETIAAWLQRNVALVKDIGTQAQGRISDAVFRGYQQRKTAAEVAKDIRTATGMAKRRANNIASDQSTKLGAALDAERQRQAGLTIWRWNHSDKRNPRPEHVARDGKLYGDDAEDRGKLSNGTTVSAPPADLPSELPWCGCNRQGVMVLDGEVI